MMWCWQKKCFYNLINITQLCDNECFVEFQKNKCMIKDDDGNRTLLTCIRNENNYIINQNGDYLANPTCFLANNEDKH